ncbi:hypothetical protein [Celeribacter arenosi]|uniref:EF-hand domain-containing protein n=1 Tax=Celeribacter arenosi TaxID=792649 RepID=A0ABP7K6M7_9RHOB
MRAGIAIALTSLIPLAATAQVFTPGENFLLNWDVNEDGVVTRAEVDVRRADMFYAFDGDENGALDTEEMGWLDETAKMSRDAQDRPGMGNRQGGQKAGNAAGQGLGNGQTPPGQGGALASRGGGLNRQEAQSAMLSARLGPYDHAILDTNGDGLLSRAEFMKGSDMWMAGRDRNKDRVITSADFGQ